ncbi:DUF493 domain-containing protein [Halomonas denitrificans]|uniref:HP0495 family protein n=1 Tax=Halomonas TaxID=2745 RepID=UPI001A8FF40E|nr:MULTISPECIES: DUF493 domain-containing protein [Halomonas]MED5297082.1 DUF493 domain-containing protein [Pseudomonadota bacterium]MBN8413472.1 DUF493 domain-containing protein [Halomonas litopenaei]MBY5931109.1 DUF493 domain-containing protein [Halomonas sp. DP8Y7-3]MBY5969013.1 DUF493 domain-containing protein [Halomonas denitrificans]MBY5984630.1 DUF493 domain-containing protein [Halomonas sp. DP5Y7-2]
MNDRTFRDLRSQAGPDPTDVTITFPCDYPIKVVGDASEDFAATVSQIVLKHDPSFTGNSLEVIDSRNGRFQSVRLTLRATGETQLKALFEELKATGRVHMVV